MGATKYGSRLELELGLGWAGSRPVWASGSWLLAPPGGSSLVSGQLVCWAEVDATLEVRETAESNLTDKHGEEKYG